MNQLVENKEAVEISQDHTPEQDSDRWLEIFSIFIHDIESPIVTVKYLLKLLEEGKFDQDNSRHKSLLRSSRIAIGRAESILYDIMAVARSGKIGIPVDMSNLVPNAVIEEAIALAIGSAEENNIEITFTNNSGDIPVQADPKLLKRTLDNLLYNAIRHTPAGGRISLYTEPGERCLFIHIKDSGSGLGDIDPTQLFEKYGQVRLRAENKHRGVGLGLYFCKLAATGMGGAILASDHPKGGAVFSVKLQKAKE